LRRAIVNRQGEEDIDLLVDVVRGLIALETSGL
jgi:hypothetical protein